MAYCTRSDIVKVMEAELIIQLTDVEELATTLMDLEQAILDNPKIGTRIQAHIDDADSTIDSDIRVKYSVPLSPVPKFIRKCSVDLARHGLHTRKEHSIGIPEGVRDRYKAAMVALKEIRKGERDLGVEPPPAKSSAVVADTDGPERKFTTDTLKDF